MATHKPNTDITVRGGMINYPAAQIPQPPPRHRPDTPQTKKRTQVRPDHQPAPPKTPTAQPPSPQPAGPTHDSPKDEASEEPTA